MPVVLRWLLQLILTNPICVRLVQGGSRRLRHLYIRAGYLGVLIVVLLGLLLDQPSGSQSYRDLAASGARAFEYVAYLQIGLICVLSPVFMAGAIAQESNPRTWEVMLTTPLSALQMVLGHLFGRLFFVLALLFASLPLFAITQYFGGVPGRSVMLSYVVSACAALLVGAIAVALAVNRLGGKRTVFVFYVAVVTYLAVTITADAQLRAAGLAARGNEGVTVMTPLNPFLALQALLNPSAYPRPEATELASMPWLKSVWMGNPVGAWCGLAGGLSTVLIAISATTVRSIGVAGNPSVAGVLRRALGLGAKGSGTREPRHVWQNPVAWREAAARQATLPKIVARWAFVAAGLLWGLGLVLYYHGEGMGHSTFRKLLLATVWSEIIVIVLIAVNISATAISREREDGTLDLLLVTPITPRDYLNGKLRGIISYLSPLLAVPICTMAMAALYVMFGGLGRSGGVIVKEMSPGLAGAAPGTIDAPVVLPESAVMLPLVLVPFIALCVMVGLQWSLKSRGTISSVVATVGMVGAVGGVIGLCGWQAGTSVPLVGPLFAALNPVTAAMAMIQPVQSMAESMQGGTRGLATARFSLGLGAAGAVPIYAVVVAGLRSSMVRTFDVTTRKLAGSG